MIDMPTGLNISTTIKGDKDMYFRTAQRMGNVGEFLTATGAYLMGRGLTRLTQVLQMGPNVVRTGRLTASLSASSRGSGSANTVWEQDNDHVEVGSNLPYAAQVHYGGTITPRTRKALAIPLPIALKRALNNSPSEIDPGRKVLRFQHYRGGKPNVIGLLIDDEGKLGFGKGPLYALASSVTQDAHPYLFIDADDERTIVDDLWPAFLFPQGEG
jgi:phage gpG-like protein